MTTCCVISFLINYLKQTSGNTPGKLSLVPPAEVLLIIGCDMRPELPVIVKKGQNGWVFVLFGTYKITGEFIKNQRVQFDPNGHKVLSHIMSLGTFHKCERYAF